MVFAEQRIVRLCENDVKSLERELETRLDTRSSTLDFRILNHDPLFFSWLYHAPPNRSFAIQLQAKDSNTITTTTLLRIPSQPTSHFGIIDFQFNVDDSSPPLIRELEVHGPDFMRAQQSSEKGSQFRSPRYLGLVVSDHSDVFKVAQEKLKRTPIYFSLDTHQQPTTHSCQPSAPLAFCYFTEEEAAGAPLMHREFVIRASVDD